MRWFRVTLKSDTHGYNVKIEMDVLRDKDGAVDRAIAFFGYWEDNDLTRIEPFVHRYNDLIDWGTNYVSTFPVRKVERLIVGATVPYSGYETNAAFERRQSALDMEFTVTSVRDLTSDADAA